MRDVAELAGVATMTVSRVLNGSARVTEETARRVFAALEELSYKPNHLARALRGSRSNTIGVLVPYLFDPFFATCAHAIDTVAQEHNYSVILSTTNEDAAVELEAVRQMAQRQVDGLVLIPAQNCDGSKLGRELAHVPVVALDRPLLKAQVDTVEVQNELAGRIGTEHLLAHGHTKIAFIGLARNLYTMAVRHRGYESAMRSARCKPEAHFDCYQQETVLVLLKKLLSRASPPTALLTSNGLTTRYVLQSLAELKVRIPSKMALIGFDDVELADLVKPPLTVLRQPVRALGHAAATMLFRRIAATGLQETKQSLVLPVELVLRESCGCKAGAKVESTADFEA